VHVCLISFLLFPASIACCFTTGAYGRSLFLLFLLPQPQNPENRDLFYDTVVQFYEEKFLTPAHIKKSFDFLFARAADEKCDNPKVV